MAETMTTSPAVYSTGISSTLASSYYYWTKQPRKSLKRTQAFLSFANTCEKEGKDMFHVIDKMNEK